MDGRREPPTGLRASPWVILAVVAGILILGDLNSRMANARRLEREARIAATEVAALEGDIGRLRTQLVQVTSGALVESWARRDAKLVLPGERLVVPIAPAGATPEPEGGAEPGEGIPGPWEVWLELLFGG